MKKYIHKIWYIKDGKFRRVYGTIETKKRFKAEMLKHFFEDNGAPLIFQLVDSPNTKKYRIVPYMNKQNQPDICFSGFEEKIADIEKTIDDNQEIPF